MSELDAIIKQLNKKEDIPAISVDVQKDNGQIYNLAHHY